MGINDEDVAAVRAASDIVAIVGQYVQLKRVGAEWSGRCPFHSDNSPSFHVNPNTNVFHCFGCQEGGDVIDFVRKQENLGFPEAVEWLANRAGVTIRWDDPSQGEGRRKRARLLETLDRAADWYHERLLTAPDAGAARSYLRARGLGGDVVREFRLGWAPDAWDELCRALGLDEATAKATGLGKRNSRGRLQDHFRGRILFPIADDGGHVISFGGRILPGGERPGNQGKYQNTTETQLYVKSKVLYGLDRAKKAIVAADTVVVCEGYTDVIGFHRSGVPLAVATCGTALTDEHVTMLRRFAGRFVLAFDADGAGQAAAERFYRWEREHDLSVAVADLPAGQDPGDLAQSDPAALERSIAGARPFLRFRLDRALGGGDLSTPEGRARAAQKAIAIVAEHPDDLVRDQYALDVAGRCRIDPDLVRDRIEDEVRSGGARRPGGAGAGRPTSGSSRSGSGGGPRPRPGPGSSGGRRDGRGPGAGRGFAGDPTAHGRPVGGPQGGSPAGAGGRTGPSGPSGPGGPGRGRGPSDLSRPAGSDGRPPGRSDRQRPPGRPDHLDAPPPDEHGVGGLTNAPDDLPPEYFASYGAPPDELVDEGGDAPAGAYEWDEGGAGNGGGSRTAGGGRDGWGGRGGRGGRNGRDGREGRGRDGRGRDGRDGRDGRGRHQGRSGRSGDLPVPPAERRGTPGATHAARSERRRFAADRTRPALEVLRHAVHDPAAVGRWLNEAVFDDPAHVAVFRALVEHESHEAARAAAPPEAAELLSRLLVESPTTEPLESLCLLLQRVTEREQRLLNANSAVDPEAVLRDTLALREVLTGLDHKHPEAATLSADRLLAWLEKRVGDGG